MRSDITADHDLREKDTRERDTKSEKDTQERSKNATRTKEKTKQLIIHLTVSRVKNEKWAG